MSDELRQALFAPRAVALIGASDDGRKNTGRPMRFLRRHGFSGRVFAINPRRDTVMGEPAYACLSDVPEPVEHALIMVPAAMVADAVRDCAAHGVRLATIYTDGFAEAGEAGVHAQAQVVEIARAGGVRLLGPNSIGVISLHSKLALSVNAALEGELGPAGRCAFVSQSGSMLGTVLSRGRARGLRFSHLVSVGNEADLGVAEILQALVEDPATDTILLFMEAIRDGTRLAAAARAAYAAGKPVIAFKLGRSSVGERLALSHTGALAGSDVVADALMRDCGIVRVDMIETLLEIAPLLRGRRPPSRRPLRVALLTTTGGGAAMVADRLGSLGAEVVGPDTAFIEAMAADGISLKPAPIIDLTLAATADAYRRVLAALVRATFCDAVVAVVGTSAQFQPGLAVEPIREVLDGPPSEHPVAVFLAPQADASLELLAIAGVAAFRTPEACADALAAYARWRTPSSRTNVAAVWRPSASARSAIQPLDEAEALDLLDALGVPTVARRLLDMPPWSHDLPYPVAAKLVSPALAHKTEAGAVTLGIGDIEALTAAIERMTAGLESRSPDLAVRGVLVQAMEGALAEVLLGFRIDASAGPVLVLGAGGRLAEVLGDVAIRIAPVDLATAHEMIAEVRALAPVRGYRGLPRGDLDALARAIVAVGRLAEFHDAIVELEANPLMVRADGVVAVDALAARRVDGGI
ncbi:MAG: acetate--CoA ligase family protein [Burkholderiaceae bacterium]